MRNSSFWLSLLLVVTLVLGGCTSPGEPLQAPANVEADESYTSEYTPNIVSEEYVAEIEDDIEYITEATGEPISPGVPPIPSKNWMNVMTEIHDKKLKNICFPGTHDSGTWRMQSMLAPVAAAKDFEDMFKQGDQIFKDIKAFLGDFVSGVIGLDDIKKSIEKEIYRIIWAGTRGLAICTSKTIEQQLNGGIRALDLRVYLGPKDTYTYHTLVGPDVNDEILSPIRSFLQSNNGEIVIVQMSAWIAEKDKTNRYQTFTTKVQTLLGEYAYQKKISNGVITNPVFEQTYNDIFSQKKGPGSRVILVYDGAPVNVTNDPLIWDSAQLGLSGSYPNTTSKGTMISDQKSKFTSAQSSGKPFRLYLTLTPQSEDCKKIVATKISNELPDRIAPLITWIPGVKGELSKLILKTIGVKEWTKDWRTVKGLSRAVNSDLKGILQNNFQGPGRNDNKSNTITILYTDFYEYTNVVGFAMEYSRYPRK